MRRPVLPLMLTVTLLLTGCDKPPAPPAGSAATTAAAVPTPEPSAGPTGEAPALSRPVAGLVPGLVFGRPIDPASGWRADRDQISDDCQTYASPAFRDAYAMAIEGKLARVTFSAASGFRLPSGIAAGSSEAAVRRAYPDFLAEPHKYAAAPAKYLTQPGLGDGEVGLRFEIGSDGTVELIHIGLPTALPLVEGCA